MNFSYLYIYIRIKSEDTYQNIIAKRNIKIKIKENSEHF